MPESALVGPMEPVLRRRFVHLLETRPDGFETGIATIAYVWANSLIAEAHDDIVALCARAESEVGFPNEEVAELLLDASDNARKQKNDRSRPREPLRLGVVENSRDKGDSL